MSFITFVPKVQDPISLDQYRSISLMGSLYKIITKVLSCRIKKVLPEVIDDCQTTFLKDRGMLDSWNVLKHDIVVVVHLFQETGCISKGCNASFITLVPKMKDLISLDQYRPVLSIVLRKCYL